MQGRGTPPCIHCHPLLCGCHFKLNSQPNFSSLLFPYLPTPADAPSWGDNISFPADPCFERYLSLACLFNCQALSILLRNHISSFLHAVFILFLAWIIIISQPVQTPWCCHKPEPSPMGPSSISYISFPLATRKREGEKLFSEHLLCARH